MKSFQIELSEEELSSINRLGTLSGLQTKKEVVTNALALFRWAARETMLGRQVCSMDEVSKTIKRFDIPALINIANVRPTPLSPSELESRLSGSSQPRKVFEAHANEIIRDEGKLETQ